MPCTSPQMDLTKGDAECNLFTGHMRSQCIDLVEGFSACVCSFVIGFAPPADMGCRRPGLNPFHCVVGPEHGCSRRNIPEAFLLSLFSSINALICLVYLLKILHHFIRNGIYFKVLNLSLLFCLCALLSHFLWALFYILQLIYKNGWYQSAIEFVLLPLVAVFSVASVMLTLLAWLGVIHRVTRRMQNEVTGKRFVPIIAVSLIFGIILVNAHAFGFDDFAAIVTSVFVLIVYAATRYAGNPLALMERNATSQNANNMHATAVEKCRKKIVQSCMLFTTFSVLFTIKTARSFDVGTTIFKICMAQGIMYSITFMLTAIADFIFTTSRKVKRVTPARLGYLVESQ